MVGVFQKINIWGGVGKNEGEGDGRGYIKNKNLGVGWQFLTLGRGGGWFDIVIAKKN